MYNYEEDVFIASYKRPEEKTLGEDFNGWWRMNKYSGEMEAKQYSDVEIKERHGGPGGWPGTKEDGVTYWVELDNGFAVGYSELTKGKATFPVVEMS